MKSRNFGMSLIIGTIVLFTIIGCGAGEQAVATSCLSTAAGCNPTVVTTDTGTGVDTGTTTTVTTVTTGTSVSTSATTTTSVPSWCTADATTDPKVGSAINGRGKWIVTCDGKPDVWTLVVAARGDTPYVTATGTNTTNPAGTANYTGTMGYNCVYLEADATSIDKSAPTITGSKTTYATDGRSITHFAVSGGNCNLVWDAGNP